MDAPAREGVLPERMHAEATQPARVRAIAPVRESSGLARRTLLVRAMLLAGDVLALTLAFQLAYWLRFANPWLPYLHNAPTDFYAPLAFWSLLLWLGAFALNDLYALDKLFGGTFEYERVGQACSAGILLLLFYSFLFRDDNAELSRLWLLFVWLLAIACVTVTRFALRRGVYALRRRGYLRERVLMVGANAEARAVVAQLQGAPTAGLNVIGFVADQVEPNTRLGLPVLGRLADLPALVQQWQASQVVVAPTAVSHERLMGIYETLGLAKDVRVRLSPGLFEILTTGATLSQAGLVPLLSLNRLRINGVDAWLKRALDYALVLGTAPLVLPVCALIALAVKRSSPGPVLHKRRVMGVGGQAFEALKFRTMVVDADAQLARLLAADPALRVEFERDHKLRADPRVTRVGGFLRRTSLDELPQLLNVLRGQMSLVGPRMVTEDEMERYGAMWLNLLTVKPGITGPWQVMGRADLPYDERVRLSMKYIRNYTLWMDLQILFQTVWVVIRGKGAY